MSTNRAQLAGVEETERLGLIIGRAVAPGDMIYLHGGLGAGKTTLTRSIAAAVGVAPEMVTSPTFTLVHEYRGGRFPVFHLDLYRFERPDELDQLGFEDIVLAADGVVIVEWALRALDRLPEDALSIQLELDVNQPDNRSITMSAGGKRSTELLTTIIRNGIL